MMATGSTIEALRIRIPEERFRFRFSRSPGPGGQNVNKVNTRVTLHFDLAGSGDLTEGEKTRIQSTLGGRISGDGVLRVIASRHRTQRANREAVVERFYELLSEALRPRKRRLPTRVPKAARRRRLSDKRLRGERKRLRGRVQGARDQ